SGGYLMKLDSLGNFKWKVNHSGYRCWLSGLGVDPSDNVIVVSGSCCYPVVPTIIKYDSDGSRMWQTSAIGIDHLNADIKTISLDESGNLYTAGTCDSGNYGVSYRRVFVNKYNPEGSIQWVKTAAKPLSIGEACTPTGIKVLDDGIYIVGDFNDSIFFDTLRLNYVANTRFIAKIGNAVPTSIKPIANTEDITIFPNPTEGKLTVHLGERKNAQICIYNLMGNCIYSRQVYDSENAKIDLGSEPTGMYFIEITSDRQRTIKRIGVD
ncbi:MAG: T9SS type A sorting domain-containing protein, partial [Bacteroidia bacterium]